MTMNVASADAPCYNDAKKRCQRDVMSNEILLDDSWPAPKGLVADIRRPQLLTGVTEVAQLDDNWRDHVPCLIRMVEIDQGGEVDVRALSVGGVLSDTGANSCMADLETHLG